MELKAISLWTREFGLFENRAQIGRIGPARWLGRKAIIDLPEDLAMPVRCSCSGWYSCCGAELPTPTPFRNKPGSNSWQGIQGSDKSSRSAVPPNDKPSTGAWPGKITFRSHTGCGRQRAARSCTVGRRQIYGTKVWVGCA
jgi:hypothetical protein